MKSESFVSRPWRRQDGAAEGDGNATSAAFVCSLMTKAETLSAAFASQDGTSDRDHFAKYVSEQLLKAIDSGGIPAPSKFDTYRTPIAVAGINAARVALLSNSGPGVLANFGPPPVLQPTVPVWCLRYA